ncbi:nucleotidyltransferase family protein [Cohaesibacter celericrescens]|uniref:nucleotidyltransferase family protein n=1 Tax=Cohaesibacter celericrescens TaxID=2067669 RepID=UPI0015E0D8FB|nr:nucleotidyltransferase family protein [Cohaesibacter celericrescens]
MKESSHLFKHKPEDTALDEQDRRDALMHIIRQDDQLMALLSGLRTLDFPDWRLVSGAIYQTVWNVLTGQPQGYGIKDYDVAYFDASDLSYEAEDAVIKQAATALPDWCDRIEVRNQARVHLWYPDRFGGAYPKLSCTDESLENYMCTTHAVAVRLEHNGEISIAAPFGLADIFSLTIRPSTKLPSNQTHYGQKAKRMSQLWPQLKVLDWHSGKPVRPEFL